MYVIGGSRSEPKDGKGLACAGFGSNIWGKEQELAVHKIEGNLRIGGIYECNFGSYKCTSGGHTEKRDDADDSDLNYRIPNEMIKRRPVVVINKHRGLCTVIPVSSTREKEHKNPKKDVVNQGICVPLQGYIPKTHFYDDSPCWAVCYAAQTIDIGRLRDIYDKNTQTYAAASVPPEMLLKLRFGVIKAIGLSSLVPEEEEARIDDALRLGGEVSS